MMGNLDMLDVLPPASDFRLLSYWNRDRWIDQ
jgi:hypothetical protein